MKEKHFQKLHNLKSEGTVGSPLYVLIVDDMEINVDILADIIKQLGYIPLPAGNAEEALSIIRRVLPQLILLDVSMPDIDGYEFCALLKRNPVTRDIPVIFISAMNSMEDKLKGLELGATDFITKPFEATEVTVRVKNQMENCRMKQELETFNHRLHKMLTEQARKSEDEKLEILSSLARLIADKCGESPEHLKNVSHNSRILTQSLQLLPMYEMKITEDFIYIMEAASKLHDLGRLWEGSSISADPHAHTETGVTILQSLLHGEQQGEFAETALAIIRFHHTDWQDSPENIPMAARIVRITDDFDQFASAATDTQNPLPESLDNIKAGSGTAYDPHITDVFLKVHRQLRI